jgi:hypothetical protein
LGYANGLFVPCNPSENAGKQVALTIVTLTAGVGMGVGAPWE